MNGGDAAPGEGMYETTAYDGQGTDAFGGLVRFGSPGGGTVAELTVTDRVAGTTATVLLSRRVAVELMAQFGVFVSTA